MDHGQGDRRAAALDIIAGPPPGAYSKNQSSNWFPEACEGTSFWLPRSLFKEVRQRETSMPSYRLRDAAVLVGAVVVGAAAGFNGGWLAAVPPKAEVETTNKLATSSVGNGATAPAISEINAATEPRQVRVVGPIPANSKQQTIARVPAQPLDDVAVPASPPPNANPGSSPAVAVPTVPAQQADAPAIAVSAPATAIGPEVQGHIAITDPDLRTTGQSGGGRKDTRKNTQKALTAKVKRKDPKLQEVDAGETSGQRTGADRSEPRQKSAQKAKRKEPDIREVDVEEAEADREPVSERSGAWREFRRPPGAEGYARGRMIVEGDRDRRIVIERQPARAAEYEEPRRGFGLFDLFER